MFNLKLVKPIVLSATLSGEVQSGLIDLHHAYKKYVRGNMSRDIKRAGRDSLLDRALQNLIKIFVTE